MKLFYALALATLMSQPALAIQVDSSQSGKAHCAFESLSDKTPYGSPTVKSNINPTTQIKTVNPTSTAPGAYTG